MKSQKGIALIVSMVVLLIATLFGVSSFQSSQLEERMAGNHRFAVSALQAAEAGVNDMLDAVLAFTYNPGGPTFCSDIGTSLSGSGDWSVVSDGSGQYATLTEPGDISGGGLTKTFTAIMKCQDAGVDSAHVIGYSRGVVPDGDYETARLIKVEIVPPGYDAFKSMLADGDITIPGNSVINGDVHSNGDLSLKIRTQGNIRFPSTGSVTASGTADFEVPANSDGSDCLNFVCTASGAAEIPVPKAQSFINHIKTNYIDETTGVWSLKEPNTDGVGSYITVLPYDPGTGECSTTGPLVEPPAFGDGRDVEIDLDNEVKIMDRNYIYFCQGDLVTGETFEGVTVMAAGNITHSGAATVSAENLDVDGNPITDDEGNLIGIDTLVVSGGNILLNGTTVAETYAAFWSVGDFTQNGTSAIFGSIVAGGSIINNGGINFTAVDSSTLYKPVSGRLEGWTELEDPGDTPVLTGLLN